VHSGGIRCNPVNYGVSGNLRSSRGFQESPGTLGYSGRLRVDPGGSGRLQEIPQFSGGLCWIPEIPEIFGELRGSLGDSAMPRGTTGISGDSGNSRKTARISVNLQGGDFPVIPPSTHARGSDGDFADFVVVLHRIAGMTDAQRLSHFRRSAGKSPTCTIFNPTSPPLKPNSKVNHPTPFPSRS
jgi:hypothetical protein